MTVETLLIEWRDARQAIFSTTDTTKVNLSSLMIRLARAEHALMVHARTITAGDPVAAPLYLVRRMHIGRAHLMKDGDTLCRMLSTGGLVASKYETTTDRGNLPVCQMCAAKAVEVMIADEKVADVCPTCKGSRQITIGPFTGYDDNGHWLIAFNRITIPCPTCATASPSAGAPGGA